MRGRVEFFDARIWRYIVGAAGKIIEEGVFVVDSKGLRLRSMDPSHVIMIDLHMPPEAFDYFDVEGEASLGVNMEELGRITRRAVKGDRFILEFDERALTVTFEGKSIRSFTLPLLDITPESLPEPRLSFNANIRMLSDTLREAVKDLEPIGDIIRLVASGSELRLQSRSELCEGEVVLSAETGAIIDMDVKEDSAAVYTLEYFDDVSTITRASDIVTVSFSTDRPCKLEYEIPNGGKAAFYIAPRIE